jgi:hypothetical protein
MNPQNSSSFDGEAIPFDDAGNLDESNASPVTRNGDGSITIHGNEGPSRVPIIGSVGGDGEVTFDHPEVVPEIVPLDREAQ